MPVAGGFAGSSQDCGPRPPGDRVGTVEAVGFSTLVAGATGILVLLVAAAACTAWALVHQPLWMWLGGILSAFIVLSITFAAPKIGVAAAIGLVITAIWSSLPRSTASAGSACRRSRSSGRGCSGSCCWPAERRWC